MSSVGNTHTDVKRIVKLSILFYIVAQHKKMSPIFQNKQSYIFSFHCIPFFCHFIVSLHRLYIKHGHSHHKITH